MLYFLPTFDRAHGFPPDGRAADGEPFRLYADLAAAEPVALDHHGLGTEVGGGAGGREPGGSTAENEEVDVVVGHGSERGGQ